MFRMATTAAWLAFVVGIAVAGVAAMARTRWRRIQRNCASDPLLTLGEAVAVRSAGAATGSRS